MDRDQADRRRASLRAADADREQLVETLRQHHVEGRLTVEELAERAAAKAALLRSVLWYGMLSVVLLVVWAMSGRDYFWPVWPILAFMLLLGWQAFNVWSKFGRFGDDRPRPRDR